LIQALGVRLFFAVVAGRLRRSWRWLKLGSGLHHRGDQMASHAAEAPQHNKATGSQAKRAAFLKDRWTNNSIKPNTLRVSDYFER